MLIALLEYYRSLMRLWSLTPDWLDNHRPDGDHFHRRRFTANYRCKQRIVCRLWFAVCTLLLCFPLLPLLVAVGLLTTFLSFAILDETP